MSEKLPENQPLEEKECRSLLSRNIKRFRARAGMSQIQLAMELNISPTFLSDIETGKKWVSPLTLARIAKTLQIEVYELFKPEIHNTLEMQEIILKCLDDMNVAFKQYFENSIKDSIEKIKSCYVKSSV